MPGKAASQYSSFSSLLILTSVCLVGCGGDSAPSLADVNNTNIKKLRGAYGLYQMNHNLAGPENDEDFKSFLKSDAGAKGKLERMGVTPEIIDDIFVCERDGQPFKIRYGLRGLGDHAIVFEAEGVDGKRFVAFTRPREVDSTEYEELWNAKASKKSRKTSEEMAQAAEAFNAN